MLTFILDAVYACSGRGSQEMSMLTKAAELQDPAPVSPRKRRFWQIHLSTALVLMLLASVFVYLNVRSVRPHPSMSEVGWPHLAVGWGPFVTMYERGAIMTAWYCGVIGGLFVNWEYVAFDGLVLGGACLVCGTGCEVVIRRRAKRVVPQA